MMKPTITVSDDITLVTLNNISVDMDFIALVFEDIAKLDIDIDMISLSPFQGDTTGVSFTMKDDDLGAFLTYVAKLKEKKIKPIISSNNSVISIFDENMENSPGFAAKVFRAIASSHTDIRIVTTSEVQISLLVTEAAFEKAYKAIQECIITQ